MKYLYLLVLIPSLSFADTLIPAGDGTYIGNGSEMCVESGGNLICSGESTEESE